MCCLGRIPRLHQARQNGSAKPPVLPPLACKWVRYVLPPIPLSILGTGAGNERFDYASDLQRQQSMAQRSPAALGLHEGGTGCQLCAVTDPQPGKDVAHPASPAPLVSRELGWCPVVDHRCWQCCGKGHIIGMLQHGTSWSITMAALVGPGTVALLAHEPSQPPGNACICVRMFMCAVFGTRYLPCACERLREDLAFKHWKAQCLI